MNVKTFCIRTGIGYWEMEGDGVMFNKFYEISNPSQREIVAIPDGCVDIQFLWRDSGCEAYVCGSFLEGGPSQVSTCRTCFGVKFQSCVVPAFLKNSVARLTGSHHALERYVSMEHVLNDIHEHDTLEAKAAVFLSHFRLPVMEPHAIIQHVLNEVDHHRGCLNVTELVDMLGYSHRYTDRVFKSHVGMSIKKYADIMRLQSAIDIVRTGRTDELYDQLGYYDQAHFIHHFKRFTSLTPSIYMNQPGQVSIV